MRIVIQRVTSARVDIEGGKSASIDNGLLILLGIEEGDEHDDVQWLCKKVISLRIFGDDNGRMNLSVQDVDGEIMVISQFTLHASTKKGNRPSFIKAAKPGLAIPLYNEFVESLAKATGKEVKTGDFGAYMQISLINDGPVTIIVDSKRKE
jgi:D-tyrosyl-tRNA(Tyr) deacylase